MIISMIAAMDKNRVIGADNDMPWHLPDDLKFFKAKTLGKTVIMGRKTFESIGCRPLPKRRNLVITRNPQYKAEGVEVFGKIEDALASCTAEVEVVIMGGGQLYQHMLPFANKLYLTQIDADIGGDVKFPDWQADAWQETEHIPHAIDDKHAFAFEFITYEKV